MSAIAHPLIRIPAMIVQIAGVWLVVSPWFLPRPYPPAATWASLGSGVIVLTMGGYKFLRPLARKVDWTGIGFSLWVLFAPWIAGFAGSASGTYNHVICATALEIAFSWSLVGVMGATKRI